MGQIKVMAGDIKEATWSFHGTSGKMNHVFTFINLRKSLHSVEMLTQENQKRLLGTVGWGAAGLLVLGPLGALAGLLLGGRRNEVTFVARLTDGRSFMAVSDLKTYQQLLACAVATTSS